MPLTPKEVDYFVSFYQKKKDKYRDLYRGAIGSTEFWYNFFPLRMQQQRERAIRIVGIPPEDITEYYTYAFALQMLLMWKYDRVSSYEHFLKENWTKMEEYIWNSCTIEKKEMTNDQQYFIYDFLEKLQEKLESSALISYANEWISKHKATISNTGKLQVQIQSFLSVHVLAIEVFLIEQKIQTKFNETVSIQSIDIEYSPIVGNDYDSFRPKSHFTSKNIVRKDIPSLLRFLFNQHCSFGGLLKFEMSDKPSWIGVKCSGAKNKPRSTHNNGINRKIFPSKDKIRAIIRQGASERKKKIGYSVIGTGKEAIYFHSFKQSLFLF